MTLFGTVVERGRSFKSFPSADDDTGHYAVVFIMCAINDFLPAKQGVGVWATLKNLRIEKLLAFTDVP